MQSADQYLGTGNNISAGIAEGMTAYGWDGDASTLATNLENAVNSAFGIASPAVSMNPTGDYVAAGVGVGMIGHDFSSDASTLASNLVSAASASINGNTLRSVGQNAMRGLISGINSGRSGVVSAMREAARAAVNAAKSELQIESPSRVFRDEVGVMAMKGFGEGALAESRKQASVIRNAARYLTGAAQDGLSVQGGGSSQRTYNQQSSVNLSGNTFYIFLIRRTVQSMRFSVTPRLVRIRALNPRQ